LYVTPHAAVRPAVIIEARTHPDGNEFIDLHTFLKPDDLRLGVESYNGNVRHSPLKEPNTWHWPELPKVDRSSIKIKPHLTGPGVPHRASNPPSPTD